jgi:hypothetical protein
VATPSIVAKRKEVIIMPKATPINWRAQKPSATFLEDNVAWEKTIIN